MVFTISVNTIYIINYNMSCQIKIAKKLNYFIVYGH